MYTFNSMKVDGIFFLALLSLYFCHNNSPDSPPSDVINQTPDNTLMVVGVCGHTLTQQPYAPVNGRTMQDEFNILKDIGLKCYRSAEFGDVNGAIRFTRFCDESYTNGIEPLVLMNPDPNSFTTPSEAHDYGYQVGYTTANVLKSHHIKYYDAGNEYDVRCRIAWPTEYDVSKLEKCAEMQRGMITGVRAADPTAKVILQATPAYMDSVWKRGVRWDISGVHAYEDPMKLPPWGNQFQYLKDHFEGKPIWITEFGGWGNRMSPTELAQWLVSNLDKWKPIAGIYNIQRIFIYELFNQDGYSPSEAQQGICLSNGTYKPQADSLKAWITRNPALKYQLQE
jgi:hypothetical protein